MVNLYFAGPDARWDLNLWVVAASIHAVLAAGQSRDHRHGGRRWVRFWPVTAPAYFRLNLWWVMTTGLLHVFYASTHVT